MATLSLPKKTMAIKPPEAAPVSVRKIVAHTPRPDLIGKYAVTRQQFNELTCRFTSWHETREQAEAIASDLVQRSGGARFLVVQIIKAVE